MPVIKKAGRKKTAAARKKKSRKKISKKKIAKKKNAGKKTAGKKKALSRTPRKASGRASTRVEKAPFIAPGPPPAGIPPVEEPQANEEAVGVVTHYYSHMGVAVIQLNRGALKTGDSVHIKGHTTDFTQRVESMEYEHSHIDQVVPGQSFGLKVQDHAREHDIVYLVK